MSEQSCRDWEGALQPLDALYRSLQQIVSSCTNKAEASRMYELISAQIVALDKLAYHDANVQCRMYSEMTDIVNVCDKLLNTSPKQVAKIKIEFDRVMRRDIPHKGSDHAVDKYFYVQIAKWAQAYYSIMYESFYEDQLIYQKYIAKKSDYLDGIVKAQNNFIVAFAELFSFACLLRAFCTVILHNRVPICSYHRDVLQSFKIVISRHFEQTMASIHDYDVLSKRIYFETLRSLNTTCRTLAYKLREIHEYMDSFAFSLSHDRVFQNFNRCYSIVQMILYCAYDQIVKLYPMQFSMFGQDDISMDTNVSYFLSYIRSLREVLFAEVDISNCVYQERDYRLLLRINSIHEALIETHKALFSHESSLANKNLWQIYLSTGTKLKSCSQSFRDVELYAKLVEKATKIIKEAEKWMTMFEIGKKDNCSVCQCILANQSMSMSTFDEMRLCINSLIIPNMELIDRVNLRDPTKVNLLFTLAATKGPIDLVRATFECSIAILYMLNQSLNRDYLYDVMERYHDGLEQYGLLYNDLKSDSNRYRIEVNGKQRLFRTLAEQYSMHFINILTFEKKTYATELIRSIDMFASDSAWRIIEFDRSYPLVNGLSMERNRLVESHRTLMKMAHLARKCYFSSRANAAMDHSLESAHALMKYYKAYMSRSSSEHETCVLSIEIERIESMIAKLDVLRPPVCNLNNAQQQLIDRFKIEMYEQQLYWQKCGWRQYDITKRPAIVPNEELYDSDVPCEWTYQEGYTAYDADMSWTLLFPREQDEDAPFQDDETEQTVDKEDYIVERPSAVKTKYRMSAYQKRDILLIGDFLLSHHYLQGDDLEQPIVYESDIKYFKERNPTGFVLFESLKQKNRLPSIDYLMQALELDFSTRDDLETVIQVSDDEPALPSAGAGESDDDGVSVMTSSTANTMTSRASRARSMDPELQAKVRQFLLERYDFVDPAKQQTVIYVEAGKLLCDFNYATGMGLSAYIFGRAVKLLDLEKKHTVNGNVYILHGKNVQ